MMTINKQHTTGTENEAESPTRFEGRKIFDFFRLFSSSFSLHSRASEIYSILYAELLLTAMHGGPSINKYPFG